MGSKLWFFFCRQSRGLSGVQHQVSHTSHTQNCSAWPWLGVAGGTGAAAVLSPAYCEESGTQHRTRWSWVWEHIDPRHLLGQHARPECQSATYRYFSDELQKEPQVIAPPLAGWRQNLLPHTSRRSRASLFAGCCCAGTHSALLCPFLWAQRAAKHIRNGCSCAPAL